MVAAVLMTLSVMVLHFTYLKNIGGFWRDEVNLINVSDAKSVAAMTHDSCPILMPVLVRIWSNMVQSDNDLRLRSLGVLIGVTLVGTLWLNSMIASRGPPLWSLVLLAANSTVIIYGDSIRAYGLGCLTIALVVVSAVNFLKSPSGKATLLLAVAVVASVQSLYHNSVLVAAICFGLATVLFRKKAWLAILQVFAAGLVAALSLVPYIPILIAGRKNCTSLYVGFQWQNLCESLTRTLDLTVYLWIGLSLALVFVAWRLFGKKKQESEGDLSRDLKLFAGATWLAAVVFFLGFLINSGLLTQPWYLLPLFALGAVCFDLGLPVSMTGRKYERLLTGYILITFLFTAFYGRQALHQRLTNIDDWSQQLNQQVDRRDFILVSPWFCGISFNHYYHGPAVWETIPPITNHLVHAYDLVKNQIQETNAMQDTLAKAKSALKSGHRVWLLTEKGNVINFQDPKTAVLDLPPAPLTTNGWRDIPYVVNWTEQVSYFLKQHAENIRQLRDTSPKGSPMFFTEYMDLTVAEGWRN